MQLARARAGVGGGSGGGGGKQLARPAVLAAVPAAAHVSTM
jgi:hypothetical protein